jgi:hypothetical protein
LPINRGGPRAVKKERGRKAARREGHGRGAAGFGEEEMKDGRTRRVERSGEAIDFASFLAHNQAVLIALGGEAQGSEFALEEESVTIGRGPGVGIAIDDSSMSRQHAVVDFVKDGFRVSDLGSTNGIFVNGSQVQSVELKHGDRLELGEFGLQLVIEKRKSAPKTYVVDDS